MKDSPNYDMSHSFSTLSCPFPKLYEAICPNSKLFYFTLFCVRLNSSRLLTTLFWELCSGFFWSTINLTIFLPIHQETKGFCQIEKNKKSKKSDKNSEVGQAPTRICLWFGNVVFSVFFLLYMLPKRNKKNGYGGGWVQSGQSDLSQIFF